MFHGTTSIERGFSIIIESITENFKESYLVAHQVVYDAVSSRGQLKEIITKSIMDAKLLFL